MKTIYRKSLANIMVGLALVLGLVAAPSMSAQAQSADLTIVSRTDGPDRGPDLVEPSKTVALRPGQKLRPSDFERMRQPYTIQRLTDRVYWLEVMGYSSTVVVGEQGVLVIDAPRDGRGAAMIDAIRDELTDLPITTLVYSHYHYDHVGDANAYVEEAGRRGTTLRIVGTTAAKRQIERYGAKIPRPTEVIAVPRGRFEFEGSVIEMGTPPAGHSTDNSWILLKDDGVLHSVDLVHPGLLEFPGFGLAEDLLGYEASVRELLTLDWQFLVAGHNNIGSHDDVQLVIDYFEDVRGSVIASLGETEFGSFLNEDKIFYAWFRDYADAVTTKAVERLRPKWGEHVGFDVVAKSHADKMLWHLYMH